MNKTWAVLALARPTFDVPFAEENKNAAFAALDSAGIKTTGSRELLFDQAAVERALAQIQAAGQVDLVLLLQVTFTDASMTVKVAREAKAPVVLWGLPEPRVGGRLRLNALCGINLAAHALARAGLDARGWLYQTPNHAQITDLLQGLTELSDNPPHRLQRFETAPDTEADRVLSTLGRASIGVVGEHPQGFDTCDYTEQALSDLAGVSVRQFPMETLFEKAKGIADDRVAATLDNVQGTLQGVAELDPQQMDKSLRVYNALQDLQQETGVSSMAIRCWPEMFTEYGCAACGPMAMMNQASVPCACEADVYGSLSALMLQELSGEPVWMADLVDIDADTAVLWHCGLAPLSMCDPDFEPEATVHTNRKMPLLHQFPLKPGRVTIARISQARGEAKMMFAGAEMIKAPMAFTGTSGTLKFDCDGDRVLSVIMNEGLEHHYALAYGDYKDRLKAIAARMDIAVLELA